MEPVKTVLQPIRSGLKILTQGIKDMQKLLDNIEDALTTESQTEDQALKKSTCPETHRQEKAI